MHTLEQLRNGELAGATRLDLSEGLAEFPDDIFDLADSLEILNLSGNQLTSLPADLSRLHRLRVLFCSDNRFTEGPAALGNCPQLEMVGFKANRISHFPASALPARLRWLILTDNQLTQLPEEIGACSRLQKLMLAGNRLNALPGSLANCTRLELLRISANRLPKLPDWLLQMPRLTWLAFAGNPFCDAIESDAQLRDSLSPIPRDCLELGDILGQGASGIIHRAEWREPGQPSRPMAAKLFKGSLTSDGLPHSEMAACIAAGNHPNLIRIAGPLTERPDDLPGLLMELIDPAYQPLAAPPSLASCTRDCYALTRAFSASEVLQIASDVASAVGHLHHRGILHGDLYGHNLLVNSTGHTLLSDFGAASFIDQNSHALQRLEARAFGCLLEELLQRCSDVKLDERLQRLVVLQHQCLSEEPAQRPDFVQIVAAIAAAHRTQDEQSDSAFRSVFPSNSPVRTFAN